ncbi:hypothetical protein D3C84_486690 [compost metagenome]
MFQRTGWVVDEDTAFQSTRLGFGKQIIDDILVGPVSGTDAKLHVNQTPDTFEGIVDGEVCSDLAGSQSTQFLPRPRSAHISAAHPIFHQRPITQTFGLGAVTDERKEVSIGPVMVNTVLLASLGKQAFFFCILSRKFTLEPCIQLTLGHRLTGLDRRYRVVRHYACHDVLLGFFIIEAVWDLEAIPSSQQDAVSSHRSDHLTVSPRAHLLISPVTGVHLVTDAVLDQNTCLYALRKLLKLNEGHYRTV